jgi:signal transduction histidine kinase
VRRRLLTAMLLVATVAVLGFGVPLAVSVQARYRDEALLTLSEEAARAAVSVPGSFARDNDPPELPDPAAGVDVALYGTDGRRLLGEGPSRADVAVDAALRGDRAQQSRGDLVVAVPISDQEIVVGAVRTSMSESVVTDRTHRTWAAMAALAAAVLVATGLLAARRSRSLALPLARLRTDAEVIGAGGEVPARPDTGVVEIDAVHAALAQAATRLNAALARERAFSADLAHQLRTPLASLRIRLENEQVLVDHDIELVDDALRDVDRLERTIDDLLALARDTERAREPHALATLLRDATATWTARLADAGRSLHLDLEPQLPWVDASPAAIRQILDVLIDNALVHGDGAVRVSGARLGQGAVVAVADEGHVTVNAEDIFVRRNPEATGEGIGLALARRLAEAEGLRLVVAAAGPGVVFHLVFGGRGARVPTVEPSST